MASVDSPPWTTPAHQLKGPSVEVFSLATFTGVLTGIATSIALFLGDGGDDAGGTVLGGAVFGVIVAVVPAVVIAAVAASVARPYLSDVQRLPRLKVVLATVGGIGAAVFAVPLGWYGSLWSWWLAAWTWATIPVHAAAMYGVGALVAHRTRLRWEHASATPAWNQASAPAPAPGWAPPAMWTSPAAAPPPPGAQPPPIAFLPPPPSSTEPTWVPAAPVVPSPGVGSRSLGTFWLATLTGVIAGGIGGAVAGTLTLPLIGTVFGGFLGAAMALVPGLLVAAVCTVVAAAMLADHQSAANLPLVLGLIGAAAAAVLAVPIGLALLESGTWPIAVGVWAVVPAEGLGLFVVGRMVSEP